MCMSFFSIETYIHNMHFVIMSSNLGYYYYFILNFDPNNFAKNLNSDHVL